jgi:anthranilate phosphoribosyltransferase
MNAAAALVASGKVAHLKDGAKLASGSIDSGAAARKLRELIEFSNKSH